MSVDCDMIALDNACYPTKSELAYIDVSLQGHVGNTASINFDNLEVPLVHNGVEIDTCKVVRDGDKLTALIDAAILDSFDAVEPQFSIRTSVSSQSVLMMADEPYITERLRFQHVGTLLSADKA